MMNTNENDKVIQLETLGITSLKQSVQSQVQDEFDTAEFEGSYESLPYLQLLNHQDTSKAGFFITLENADAVGFEPSEEWQQHLTVFQSGDTAEGYRSLTARMLILRHSELMMFDRDSGDFIGGYQSAVYDRASMVLKTRYLIYLVDANNQLLHSEPLLFTAKGSFSGDFGETYRAFRREMSRAFGVARGTRKQRSDRFMALSVLAVRVQPTLKGKEKKSWVCSIADVNHPTPEDWMTHFIGYDEDSKLKIYGVFDEWVNFGQVEHEISAQAKSQAEQTEGKNSLSSCDANDNFSCDDNSVIEF